MLVCGKASQGPLQQLLRSGLFVLGASTVAINSTQGTIQGPSDFNSFRLRWRPRAPTDPGWQRNWYSAYQDVQVPIPFYLPTVTTDIFFFSGPF